MTIRLLLCYIIQAVAWDRAEKYRCPWGATKKTGIKKLLTNVDEHDILDKLFRASAYRWNNKIKKLLTNSLRCDNLLKLSQTTTNNKNFDNWTIDNNPEDSRYNSDSVRSTRGLRQKRLSSLLVRSVMDQNEMHEVHWQNERERTNLFVSCRYHKEKIQNGLTTWKLKSTYITVITG